MGYYVQITKSSAMLPKNREQEAYEIMCSLNTTHDHEKRGGSWGADGKQNAKWFSWMDANYPETCKDAGEIFEMLGFEIARTNDGIHIIGYDSKAGQEDLFLKSIINLLVGEINWMGEDGDTYKNKFYGDNCIDGTLETLAIEHQP